MRLFPKEVDFFELFERGALNAIKASKRLLDGTEDFSGIEQLSKEIHEFEQEGDMLTHDIIRKLNKTFLTPIDREDIHTLATTLDDVVDLIWASVDRIEAFQLKEPTTAVKYLAKDLHTLTEVIHKAIRALRDKNYEHVQEHCIEINRLENRMDRTFRDALGQLFEDYSDNPVMIIKWKEIYEFLEDASDSCEDVANVLESIVLKHA